MAVVVDSSLSRECTKCRTVKTLTEKNYRVVKEIRNGSLYIYTKRHCRRCEFDKRVEWGRKNKERQNALRRQNATKSKYRENNLKKFYGITEAIYQEMLSSQGGVCAICGTKPDEWHRSGRFINLAVDHDHSDGKVRGLLCGHCNRGLGSFKDDTARLLSAADYLRKHNG